MAELYVMTQTGLQRANDTFNRSTEEAFHRNIAGFDDYLNLANSIKEDSRDIKVYGNDLKPLIDENGIQLLVGDEPFKVTEWSLSQFATKVGVPYSYAVNMAENRKYDLFKMNFQSWIDSHAAGKEFLVRTYGSFARGVLSDSYQPTDVDFVLPLFRDGLQTSNMNFKIDKGIMNPEYTNIRVIADRQIDVGGDPHFVGFNFVSSDVGRASLKMEFFIYRYKCSNGMMFGKHGGELIKIKHTNKNFYDPNVFIDTVAASMSNLDYLVDKATEALVNANRRTLSDKDIELIIQQYKSFTGAGKRDTEFVANLVKERMTAYNTVKPTLWSATNAFTEIAQELKLDKAEAMEQFAGHLLFSKSFAA